MTNVSRRRFGIPRFSPSACALLLAALHATACLGADYYVAADGSDSADGRSPRTAWHTLARTGAETLRPGDRVLLRRGDQWRESLRPVSGSEQGPVTYGAYGEGEKPALLGSVAKDRPEDWRHEGGNVWSTVPRATGPQLDVDVGNIIFDGGASCGWKVFDESGLTAPGRYWYDPQKRLVKLVCEKNPAEKHRSIELALRRHVIDQSGRGHVVYEGLALRYGAAHGIGGGNTHHVTVRDCDISYIGGGSQYGGKRTVRFGNGVEFWGPAHDCLVERCRIWEVYDAALTNQNQGAVVAQRDITYRHNLIWNCEFSFEYWNRPEQSVTRNIRFEHNTCYSAGGGWGHAQRPDPGGRHLCFYASPADAREIVVRNNVFCGATNNAFFAHHYTLAGLKALALSHNCWWQPEGQMVLLKDRRYTMAQFAEYQRETGQDAGSLAADPRLADPERGDFRLRAGSPCVDAGIDAGAKADFAGKPVPRGKVPDIGAHEFAGE